MFLPYYRAMSRIILLLVVFGVAQPFHVQARIHHEQQSLSAIQAPQVVNLTITARWVDSAGKDHPMRRIPFDVFELGKILPVKRDNTDNNGTKIVSLPVGQRKVFVRIYAQGSKFQVVDSKNQIYSANSSVVEIQEGMTTAPPISFITPNPNNKEQDRAFAIADGMVTAVDYVTAKGVINNIPVVIIDLTETNGRSNHNKIDRIRLDPRFWDNWDILHHEYAHHIQAHLNITDLRVGGDHFFDQYTYQGSTDIPNAKENSIKFMWSEGWATYFAMTLHQVMNTQALQTVYANDILYDDNVKGLDYNIETLTASFSVPKGGELSEISMQGVFWDFYDSNRDAGDALNLSDQYLWDIVNQNKPKTLSAAVQNLLAGQPLSRKSAIGCILAEHNTSAKLIKPANGTKVSSQTAPTFEWKPDDGSGGNLNAQSFRVEFYKNADGTLLFTSPVLPAGTTQYQPPLANWKKIADRGVSSNGTVNVSSQ